MAYFAKDTQSADAPKPSSRRYMQGGKSQMGSVLYGDSDENRFQSANKPVAQAPVYKPQVQPQQTPQQPNAQGSLLQKLW